LAGGVAAAFKVREVTRAVIDKTAKAALAEILGNRHILLG